MTDTTPTRDEAVLDHERIPTWPPLKKALWDVVTGEKLNDGHYINAYQLTDKLYAAAVDRVNRATDAEIGGIHRSLASAPAPASGGVDAAFTVVSNLLRDGCTYADRKAAADFIRSALSPAATPVSEAGGELHHATGERITRKDLNNAYRMGREEGRLAAELLPALAKPASSPAGGDLREVVHSLMEAGKISCWMDVNEHIEAFQTITEALSQSTSAGRVGE